MKLDHRSLGAGHARLHAAHTSGSNLSESRGHGRREKPSPAFDSNDLSNGTGGFSHILRTLPLTVGLTLLAALLLITLAAAAALRTPDPVALTAPLSWGAIGLSSLLGGILSGRRNPASPVAGALVSGVIVALLLTVAGFCAEGGNASLAPWLVRLGVILVHLLGGYVSRPRERAAAHHEHPSEHRHGH